MPELNAESGANERIAFGSAPKPELRPAVGPPRFQGASNGPPVVRAAAITVGLISVFVLAGWALDISLLKSLLPQLTTMKANTAFGLGLLAAALWLVRTEALRARFGWAVWAMAAIVIMVASITLCEYAFNWNSGLDELLFRDPEHLQPAYPPGRLAPATGVCFLMLSAALLLLDKRPRLSVSCALITIFISLVALIGYLYNLPSLVGAAHYTSLALHTIIGLLALSVGTLASRPSRGLAAFLIDSQADGLSRYTSILGAIVLPIVLGSLTLLGYRDGFYGSEFSTALFTVLLIVLTVALVWFTGAERQKVEARRIHAEAALRDSEERFRTMADNIPNLAWMARGDGHIFWYNQRFLDYTGKTPEQLEGWDWSTVHDPEMYPIALEKWKHAIATGTPFELVFPLRAADGMFRPFLTRVQPVKGPDGAVVCWFGTNTDISAERKAQEDLRSVNRQLEEYAFVSSHDLQEPIRMVNIYTQLLLRQIGDELDDRTRLYASYVQDGVKRMDQLIQDLLQFSRTVNCPVEDRPHTAACLNLCLNHALSALALSLEETKAVVTSTPLPCVRGEETQLTQVFQNLLSNSLKYRPKNEIPRIHISAKQESGNATICVHDNGIGFEPEYAERIFGLFKRLHKDEYPGTGLGLAICQRIVERYGGRIWAEGHLNAGASFHFSLPIVEKALNPDS